MFLLAFHIVAIGILIVATWGIAYRLGHRAGERELKHRLGLDDRPSKVQQAPARSDASA